WSGGLNALQTASIVAAFPFVFILLFMMVSLQKGLSEEAAQSRRAKTKEKKVF
ncbi:MAG TPA: BCCT family transporter, partial [Pseudogracilibacillus sp.]|nr:BCCT family transporter [Pseudogracilibacillus sp.]